jgi:hypothetical protein
MLLFSPISIIYLFQQLVYRKKLFQNPIWLQANQNSNSIMMYFLQFTLCVRLTLFFAALKSTQKVLFLGTIQGFFKSAHAPVPAKRNACPDCSTYPASAHLQTALYETNQTNLHLAVCPVPASSYGFAKLLPVPHIEYKE